MQTNFWFEVKFFKKQLKTCVLEDGVRELLVLRERWFRTPRRPLPQLDWIVGLDIIKFGVSLPTWLSLEEGLEMCLRREGKHKHKRWRGYLEKCKNWGIPSKGWLTNYPVKTTSISRKSIIEKRSQLSGCFHHPQPSHNEKQRSSSNGLDDIALTTLKYLSWPKTHFVSDRTAESVYFDIDNP